MRQNCISLSPDAMADLDWLPATCAYRLRAAGQPLREWHPLVSGDPESIHAAGISVRSFAERAPADFEPDVDDSHGANPGLLMTFD